MDDIPGWVSDFHKVIEKFLIQMLGRPVTVWRDTKTLGGNTQLTEEILESISNTAILVTIISPAYMGSPWCKAERENFLMKATELNMVTVNNKHRIFKVIKTPVDFNQHPPEIRDMLGYAFYQIEEESGRSRELNRMFGKDEERQFLAKAYDLAFDIADLLKEIQHVTAGPGSNALIPTTENGTSDLEVSNGSAISEESNKKAFLAYTSFDLRENRDLIAAEIKRRGYEVVPNGEFPYELNEFKAFIQKNLTEVEFAVQLISNAQGMVPEGGQTSILEIQNQLLSQKCHDSALQRLIWMNQSRSKMTGKTREFVDELHQNPDLHLGADILATSIEQFKSEMELKLKTLNPAKDSAMPNQAKRVTTNANFEEDRIFLGYAAPGMEAERELIYSRLSEWGYKVVPQAPFPEERIEVEVFLRQKLEKCFMAIELIGEHPGIIPANGLANMIEIQHALIALHTQKTGIQRRGWLAADPAKMEVDMSRLFRRLEFVNELLENENQDFVLNWNPGSIEAFLNDLELPKLVAPAPPPTTTIPQLSQEYDLKDKFKRVYLIYERDDRKIARPLRSWLFDFGLEVKTQNLKLEPKLAQIDHLEKIALCDAIVIFYGRGDEYWVETILRDIRDSPDHGRKKPMSLIPLIFLAGEETEEKEDLLTREAEILHGYGTLPYEKLEVHFNGLKHGI